MCCRITAHPYVIWQCEEVCALQQDVTSVGPDMFVHTSWDYKRRHGLINSIQVKCDESKPACSRCSKRKSSCTYGKKLEWRHNTIAKPRTTTKEGTRRQSSDHVAEKLVDAMGPDLTMGDPVYESSGLPQFMNTSAVLDELAEWDEQFASMSAIEYMPGFDQSLDWPTSTPWATDVTEPISMVSAPLDCEPSPMSFDLSVDRSTALMNFYFERVAPVFSCYDGGKNPFHHLIAQVWRNSTRSPAEYNILIGAIQGLSAVFLAKEVPSLRDEALNLQRQTQQQLEEVPEERRHDSKYLFALVLLGISWMYSQNVPSSFQALKRLRDILQLEATKSTSEAPKLRDRELRFFWGLQIHCEVFFACTDEVYCLPSIPMQIRIAQDDHTTSIYPHPFTGVANSISTALLEVIQLVKRQRRLSRSHAFASRGYLDDLQDLMDEAVALEQRVFTQSIPGVENIEDPGDPATPIEHLVKMARCHHETALLQLYRVFPDLLSQRLGLDEDNVGQDYTQTMKAAIEKHCLNMAMHILDTLSSIPDTSSTTPFQTILLLSTSSELRFIPDTQLDIEEAQLKEMPFGREAVSSTFPSSIGLAELEKNIQIMNARDFVVKRLSTSQQSIPGDRLPKLLGIVRKIWSLLDNSGRFEAAYWFDVVMQ
ncbi:hypothetical protein E4T43_08865 [Aureobasidium subglaciale]|nr:hypothetical protein E4T43_08865 [Aureobasidium subglaciale]